VFKLAIQGGMFYLELTVFIIATHGFALSNPDGHGKGVRR
jgi:hypothetical protein